jgi:hypothetical protein
MKKFLISAAAVAALATSAMAFSTTEVQNYKYDVNNSAPQAVKRSENDFGNALFYPYYSTLAGYKATIKVINTKDVPVVAKVVFYDRTNSEEVKDFNIYLSPKDEWIGTVAQDASGNVIITSTDDSAVVQDSFDPNSNLVQFASADNPMVTTFKLTSDGNVATNGYFEVIGLAEFNDSTTNLHDKAAIRQIYLTAAEAARDVDLNNLSMTNGVIDKTSGVLAPDINLTGNAVLKEVEHDALTGTLTLSSDSLKTNMLIKPIALDIYNDDQNTGLLYIPGEKANIADVAIDNNGTGFAKYKQTNVEDSLKNLTGNIKEVYVPYRNDEMYDANGNVLTALLATVPMKSILKDMSGSNVNCGLQSDYSLKMRLDIYNNTEDKAGSSAFSPYSTPYLTATKEVTFLSGFNAAIKQANDDFDNAFAEGFAVIKNTDTTANIPAVITEMKATNINGTYVTDWFTPAAK